MQERSVDIDLQSVSVLLETEDFAVVNKPPKLLVHRSEIANKDEEFLLQKVRDHFGRKVWPLTRLDRGTSGAIIFAFSPEALKVLKEQANISKFYCAVTRGYTAEEGRIDHLLKPPIDPYLRVQKTEPQQAISNFRRIATAEVPVPHGSFLTTRLSLVSLWLETGRQHQIRRHLKWISHPVIGDSTYGKGPLNRALFHYFGFERMLLHCSVINITNAWSKNYSVYADPFPDFNKVIDRCGWRAPFDKEILSRKLELHLLKA